MLSLIAQVSTSALVKACACRATHVDVTQDSKEKTAVTFQIVRFLETVVGTEFACRGKMTKMFLAGTWCLTNFHFFSLLSLRLNILTSHIFLFRSRCYSGFSGANCSIPSCHSVNNCSGHGVCVEANLCKCDMGYTGADCSNTSCEGVNYCSGEALTRKLVSF